MTQSTQSSNDTRTILDQVWTFCEGLLRNNYPNHSLKGFITAVDRNTDPYDNSFRMHVKRLRGTKVELDRFLHASISERLSISVDKYQRLIEDVYYYQNFTKTADSLKHFEYKIDPKENITFDNDGFKWPKAHIDFQNLILIFNKERGCFKFTNDQKFYWKSGGEDLLSFILSKTNKNENNKASEKNEVTYFNEFDLFFLPPETERLIFLPIPILSCVSLYIVLAEDKNAVIDWSAIYKEARYLAINSIFAKLRAQFLNLERNRKLHKFSEIDFCRHFIRELAYAFLPRAYYFHDTKTNGAIDSSKFSKELHSLFIEHCSNRAGVCKSCNVLEGKGVSSLSSFTERNIEDVMLDYSPCPYKVLKNYLNKLDRDDTTQEKIEVYNYDKECKVSEAELKDTFILEISLDNSSNEETKKTICQIWFYIPSFIVPFKTPKYPHNEELILIQNYPGYQSIVNEFKTQVDQNWRNLYNRWQNLRSINRYATKAAISQAMLRNISHNHGSHVLVNLVDAEKISQKQINKFVNKKGSYNYDCGLEVSEKKLSGQTAIFNKFIKQRMDFLSEITFGVSNMVTSIKLSEVYREFDKNLILLNHIAGIDNFKFRIDFKHAGNISLDQLLVAFPSDILGCQALYNIIEAVIRNTAKYGITTGADEPETVFTLEFSDLTTGYNNENQFYQVEIYDNKNIIDEERLLKIQNIVKMTVIDESTNELRSEGLGILEMQACAAFLRQIDVSEIDNEEYYPVEMNDPLKKFVKFPILEPFLKDNNRLGYRFYVQKPKEFLFVGDWKTITKKKSVKLERYGINFLTAVEFIDSLKERESFHHQFLLYDDTIKTKVVIESDTCSKKIMLTDILQASRYDEGVSAFLAKLPVRMMDVTNSKKDLVKILNQMENKGFNFDKLDEEIWILWKDQLFSRGKLNEKSVIKLISGPIKAPIHENEYTICLLDHNTKNSYQACKKIEGIKAIEPLSSNVRKKFPGWKDSYGLKINEYIDAIQKKDCQNLIFDEYKNVLIDKGLNIELNQITTYDEINQMLNAKRAAGRIDATVVAELKKIGASIKSKFEIKKTYSLTRNVIKIFEAYTNTVIVIDERIQNYAKGNYHKIKNQEIFENIKCYIPSKGLVNLADREMFEEQKTIIQKFIDDKKKSSNFLVIHYGLLERLYNSEEKRSLAIKNQLSEWAQSIRVVVTSGRGKHSLDLPDDVCYVNLSPVTNVFIENRSKYAINYLLNQSRR